MMSRLLLLQRRRRSIITMMPPTTPPAAAWWWRSKLLLTTTAARLVVVYVAHDNDASSSTDCCYLRRRPAAPHRRSLYAFSVPTDRHLQTCSILLNRSSGVVVQFFSASQPHPQRGVAGTPARRSHAQQRLGGHLHLDLRVRVISLDGEILEYERINLRLCRVDA